MPHEGLEGWPVLAVALGGIRRRDSVCPMEALYLGSLTDLKGFGFVMASRNLPPAVTRQLDCPL